MHDTDCEFSCCVDFIKMIKQETDFKCNLMLPTLCVVVQRLFYRKCWHVTSCYKYRSHGLFYVLLLLIYGHNSLLVLAHDTTTTAMATKTTTNQIKVNKNNEHTTTSNEINRILAAVRIEDTDDEYFEDDQDDDKDYKELISNKSGMIEFNIL